MEYMYHITRRLIVPALLLAVAVFHSCRDEAVETVADGVPRHGAIQVGAVVDANSSVTRSAFLHEDRHDTITVTSGEFSFSYLKPYSDVNAKERPVTDLCRIADGLGFVYPDEVNGQPLYGQPLQWAHLNMHDAVFVLDNVDERDVLEEYNDEGGLVYFGPDWSGPDCATKYDAAMESPDCTNDIVWAYEEKVKYGSHVYEEGKTPDPLLFSLTHRMSRLCVVVTNITTETVEHNGEIEVELANIVTHPKRFNRLTGDVELPDAADRVYASYTLFSGHAADTECIGRNSDADNYTLTTPNLILPPDADVQTRAETPVLTVRAGGKTYSAPIPGSMIYEDEQYPVSLQFRPAHHLTLRVRLQPNDSDPTIEFLPVMVRRWENVGTYKVNGLPATAGRGINSQADLDNLIRLYNTQSRNPKDEMDIAIELMRYGRYRFTNDLDGSGRLIWSFDLNADIPALNEHFDKELYRGVYPVEINFNGHTIGGMSSTAEVVDVGIHNIDELNDCINIFNLLESDVRIFYGDYRNLAEYKKPLSYGFHEERSGKWHITIDILDDIDIVPEQLFMYMVAESWGSAIFDIDFHGHTVCGASTKEQLIKASGLNGIRSQRQLEAAIEMINRFTDSGNKDLDHRLLDYLSWMDGGELVIPLYADLEAPAQKIKPLNGFTLRIETNGHSVGGVTDETQIRQMLAE